MVNQTATAGERGECQSNNILTSALSSSDREHQSGLPCLTTIDSLMNSETAPDSKCKISEIKRQQSPATPISVKTQHRGKRNTASEAIDLNPSRQGGRCFVGGCLRQAWRRPEDTSPQRAMSNLRSPISAVRRREVDIESLSIASPISVTSTSGLQFDSDCINTIPNDESRSESNPLSATLHPLTAQRPIPPEPDQEDGELGELRLREVQSDRSPGNADDELGRLRIREIKPRSNIDPELGTLRVREVEPPTLPNVVIPPPSSPQLGSLLAQIGYFQTNNIFSGVDPVEGGLLSTGATLVTTPKLGPNTDIIAAIDGSLIRYIEQSEPNYNQVRVRAGIRQQLSPRMYGEIGWINQQLFRAESGDRFLHENALRLVLRRRDRLTDKLRLDTFYELRVSNADPETRSRMINSLAVSLSYNIQNNFLVGLDYQYALSDFTQREREDEYHRLLGRLSYAVSRSNQINLQGGFTFGGSSDPNIDFNNFFLSVTYTVELGDF